MLQQKPRVCIIVGNSRISPLCKWDLHSSGMLLLTDVSGRPIGPIFKDQTHQEDFLGVLNLEDGPDTSCRNSRYLTADLCCLTSQNSEYLTFCYSFCNYYRYACYISAVNAFCKPVDNFVKLHCNACNRIGKCRGLVC